jgi:hypothetical protein
VPALIGFEVLARAGSDAEAAPGGMADMVGVDEAATDGAARRLDDVSASDPYALTTAPITTTSATALPHDFMRPTLSMPNERT